MSHLVLMTKATAAVPEASGSDVEQGLDEQRPLLGNEETSRSTSPSQQEDTIFTTTYNLIPDASLPAQVRDLMLQDFFVTASQEFILESERYVNSIAF